MSFGQWFLVVFAVAASPESETLLPGQSRELSIAGGQAHLYHVEVTDAPLLVVVEQRGLDLVVEATGSEATVAVDAGDHGWGSEVLLLEEAGEYRIAIRAKERLVGKARYAIALQELTAADERRAALALLSRSGQAAAPRTPEAWRRAAALHREALAAWHALGDRRWEAETLYALAILERDTSELRPAAGHYLEAVALWRELRLPHLEAATLNGLGKTRSAMGENAAAREDLNNALALWKSLGEPFQEAETRGNLCALEQLSGALPAAFDCYQETLVLFRELGYGKAEAQVLNSLGGIHDGLGEPDAALAAYGKALALWRDLGEQREVARALNNIAVVHRALGDWQEALRVYRQVREILQPLGDRSLEAARLNNVGFTYNALGEPQRALPFLDAALTIRQETNDRGGEILTLNNLGDARRRLGDAETGLAHHRRALALAKALGDRRQEALTRLRLVEIEVERGDSSAALCELDPTLASLREMGLRQREAQALQLRGRALILADRLPEALPVLHEVLARRRTLRDRAGEAEALQALAAAERSFGLPDAARIHAEEAMARVEELRSGFVSPNLRASFLATQRRAYALMIDLLMDQHAADPRRGYDRAAFEVSERARARSLLDVLSTGSASPAGSAIPAGLFEHRQSLRRRLSSLAYQQLQQSGAKAEALGGESESLRAELDGVEAEIRRLDPLYSTVAAPPELSAQDVAALLDPDSLLLEYSLGEERSYLWAVGAGFFRTFELPRQREIDELGRRFHEELSTYEAGRGKNTAAALSRILLDPAWSDAVRFRRLVVVPDAVLHLLPFGALPAPGSGGPLLDQVEIAYLPSATTLALQRRRLGRRPSAAVWAAVLADPVFRSDDPRLAGSPAANAGRQDALREPERSTPEEAPLAALERLPATRREAEAIKALAPAGQVWTGLDLAASREAVLSGKLLGARVVHFGTHALANTRTPELSGLVLSLVDAAGRPREGFLSLSDIYDLDLQADLVVLSGCQTALGKEVGGEGIMGLTRGFLYAGVPRVVASLWKVQDRTTAELMTRFYRALWRDNLPAAAALREAQRSLRRDPRYRNPYSWAGFVLQGEWR